MRISILSLKLAAVQLVLIGSASAEVMFQCTDSAGHKSFSNVDNSGLITACRVHTNKAGVSDGYICKKGEGPYITHAPTDITGQLTTCTSMELGHPSATPIHTQSKTKKQYPAAERKESKQTHYTGTAFAVGESLLLTNNHVVEKCSRIRTQNPGTIANIKAQDKETDLALLETTGRFSTIAQFREDGPANGEELMIAGFPLVGILGQDISVAKGIVSSTRPFAKKLDVFTHSAPTQPGNSGGPVFDQSGRVIGVVVGKLDELKVALATGSLPQNINIGINGSAVLDFLKKHGATPAMNTDKNGKRVTGLPPTPQNSPSSFTALIRANAKPNHSIRMANLQRL